METGQALPEQLEGIEGLRSDGPPCPQPLHQPPPFPGSASWDHPTVLPVTRPKPKARSLLPCCSVTPSHPSCPLGPSEMCRGTVPPCSMCHVFVKSQTYITQTYRENTTYWSPLPGSLPDLPWELSVELIISLLSSSIFLFFCCCCCCGILFGR